MQAVPLTSRRVHVFPVQCHVVRVSNAVQLLSARKQNFGSFVSTLHKSELLRGNALALTTGTHRLDGDSCTTTPPPLDNLGSGDGGARAVH